MLVALRDNEDRVRFLGYDPVQIKMLIFALSAAIAALAGILFVPQVGHYFTVEHGRRAVDRNGDLGGASAGAARWSVPFLGALLVSYGRSYFSESYPDIWQYFLGALFIGSVLLFPQGIVGFSGEVAKPMACAGPACADARTPSAPDCRAPNFNERDDHIARCRRRDLNAAAKSAILDVQNVTVSFDGFQALERPEFSMAQGELRFVIGPNGAGKTTLLDVVTGKTRPQQGRSPLMAAERVAHRRA